MKIFRGDIVLLDFPFSTGTASKVRPAVVVQADGQNAKLNSTIVAMITRTTHRVAGEPTQFGIEINSVGGQATGLRFDSAVNCANLYTVHESAVNHRIGRLPAELGPALDSALRASLGLK